MDLRNELNDSQLQAVLYCEGPQLVIAGAGSGKTRVLTYKIAHLVQGDETMAPLAPWNILALTFTNKAANEMKERIAALVGPTARYLNMGTFHSVFSRILRAEASAIGYSSKFTIYDETDSRSLLKSIIKELDLDDKVYKPATVHNIISNAKNYLELPADYKASQHNAERDRNAKMDKMPLIYEMYQQRLRTSNAMDFDDLLVYTYILFKEHEEVRQKYGERFKYVLVDEYQDTNAVQQKIVLQLVRDHHRVCVVGDDAQSIYGFRGANIDNILDFQQKFEGVRLYKLEQNYRSTQNIVAAANSLILHNQRQIPKEVFSQNAQGDLLQLKNAYSDREEASIVCNDIKCLRKSEGGDWSDFAILYRTNAQSRTFEDQMRRDGIPYRIFGGLSFYQRKEIKDVIAYLRLVVNNHDEEALRRIINYPKRGIGASTIDKVLQQAHLLQIPAWDVLAQPVVTGLQVNKGTATKLMKFVEEMRYFIDQASVIDVYTLGSEIVSKTGIAKEIYSSTDPDDISRQENLQELMASMQDFVDTRRETGEDDHVYIDDFLQEVSLMSDLDSNDDSDSKVSLMTIHSAKGLEFPTVFIVGMEENIFPSPMSCDSLRKLEEERRLLYVAITRAEKHCILTCAQNRYRYGHQEFDTPSRFLREINPRFMKVHGDSGEGQNMPWDKGGRRASAWKGDAGTSRFRRVGEMGDVPEWMNRGDRRMQNSDPVASQFKADPVPKITSPRRPETPVDPFSPSFHRTLEAAKGNAAPTEGRRLRSMKQYEAASRFSQPSLSAPTSGIDVGTMIEHNRFGKGRVVALEGTGENQKATVDFVNCGQKRLLLKFAKFTVV